MDRAERELAHRAAPALCDEDHARGLAPPGDRTSARAGSDTEPWPAAPGHAQAPPPAARRKHPPERLADLVPRVIAELGLDRVSEAAQLADAFTRAVGEHIAPHCRCQGARHGVVLAAVSDSAWAQRVQLEKPRILHALRAALGDDRARDLRIVIAPLA